MAELLNEIMESNVFLEDPLEYFFKRISIDFNNLIKYETLFKDGSHEKERKYYEQKIRELYDLLIIRFKYFIADYYKEKIDNIYSKATESLSWADETGETGEVVKTVKAVEIVETEEEMDCDTAEL